MNENINIYHKTCRNIYTIIKRRKQTYNIRSGRNIYTIIKYWEIYTLIKCEEIYTLIKCKRKIYYSPLLYRGYLKKNHI